MFIVLYLVLVLKTSTTYSTEDLAVLEPRDPHFEEGETLILNCTLTWPDSPWNSSSLYIRSQNINFYAPYLVPLNEKTAQLTLENVNILRSGLFLCMLPDMRNLGKLAKQFVHITRRPIKPELTKCTLKKMEIFECFWLPSFSLQKNHTQAYGTIKQMLQIFNLRDNLTTIDCSKNVVSSCSFSLTEEGVDILSRLNEEICVRISLAGIAHKEVYSDIKCLNISDTIFPEAPEFVGVNQSDEGCLIEWRQPFYALYKNVHLTFYITLIPSYDKTTNFFYEVNGLSFLLESCHPHTNYSACISSMSVIGGYHSEFNYFNFETSSTVPCQPVELSPYMVLIDYHSHKMLIYWQPTQEKNYCGQGFQYVLLKKLSDAVEPFMVDSDGTRWLPLKNISADSSFLQFTVPNSCIKNNCSFTIAPKNNLGYRLKDLLPLRWTSDESLINHLVKVDDLIVEGSELSVFLSWNVRDHGNVNFSSDLVTVVYTCRSLFHGICRGDLNWLVVNPNIRHYNLSVDSPRWREKNYGVAVFVAGFSHEIFWPSKVYELYGKTLPPSQVEVQVVGDDLNVLWSFSQDVCSYVTHFVIFYCRSSNKESCDGNVTEVVVFNGVWMFKIQGLELDSPHLVWMASVSRMSMSPFTEKIVTPSTATKKYLISFSVLLVLLTILFIFCLIKFYRRCRDKYSSFAQIDVPRLHVQYAPAPVTGTDDEPINEKRPEWEEKLKDGYVSIDAIGQSEVRPLHVESMPADPEITPIGGESAYSRIRQLESPLLDSAQNKLEYIKMNGIHLGSCDIRQSESSSTSSERDRHSCDINDYPVVMAKDAPQEHGEGSIDLYVPLQNFHDLNAARDHHFGTDDADGGGFSRSF